MTTISIFQRKCLLHAKHGDNAFFGDNDYGNDVDEDDGHADEDNGRDADMMDDLIVHLAALKV